MIYKFNYSLKGINTFLPMFINITANSIGEAIEIAKKYEYFKRFVNNRKNILNSLAIKINNKWEKIEI